MGRKKTKRSQGTGGGTAMFEMLENSPVARRLASNGFPPVQFSVRMQEIIEKVTPTDPHDPPSLRAVYFLQGIAGAMAGRLSDDPIRDQLRQQLEVFDDVLSWTDAAPLPVPTSGKESAAVLRAWELLEFAAGLLNYLQGDAASAVGQRAVALQVSPEEFKAIVQQGGLAPDTLAALIPDPSAGTAALPVPRAAEVCFFLVVAVIGGPAESRDAILVVAERLAEALDALGPPQAGEGDGDQDFKGEFISAVRGGRDRPRSNRTAPVITDNWYQLKITLRGIAPPIWRRIVVPDCTLDTLDAYVRKAMGWTGGHLSGFEIDRVTYSAPHPFTDELLDDSEDGRGYTLGQFVQQGTKKLQHSYDFGDGWEHIVVIEQVFTPEKAPGRPTCTAGARACPPEDCGGIWGYQELLDALKNPKSRENKERLEWLGREWKPEAFSAESVTRRLS